MPKTQKTPRATKASKATKASTAKEQTALGETADEHIPEDGSETAEAAGADLPAAKAGEKQPRPKRAATKKKDATDKKGESPEYLFALDIGTRSVIGIVAEKTSKGLNILATERQEHKTRAMLDGQIHDVPQVAAVIDKVKRSLVKRTGPLHHASVAAAGRALYTMTAEAEMEINGVISPEQQRALDFAGVQNAQSKLTSSKTIEDVSMYYCVGYSTIKYTLDGVDLKLLIGQRGKLAKATVIATFLPRQVIDSMQSALAAVKLDMQALTLEPIAAINVLIPPTMRHLNLVLVDIGAGTSDVAITKNGSVIAYGMVPLAGDEITEAISQNYLLDFNVAEKIKRDASNGKDLHFTDILGTRYDLTAQEVLEPIMPTIHNLANAISKQIMELNGSSPQAVMLVGGGSLTPYLAKLTAEALDLPEARVAVRHPSVVNDIVEVPPELHSPDSVTPLGILKIASLNTLHFLTVYVNDRRYSLFNFRELTVSDALLNAGIQLKKFNGHPGLGLMVTVNGKKKFFPGTLGTLAVLKIDGEEAALDTPIKNDSHIVIEPGSNGTTPEVRLEDVIDAMPEYLIYVNGREKRIAQQMLVNGKPAELSQLLRDNDVVKSREPKTVGEALASAGYSPTGKKIRYTLNGTSTQYTLSPDILLNDEPVAISMPVHEGDHFEYAIAESPKLSDILKLSEIDTSVVIYFNDVEFKIPSASITLTVNGRKASPGTLIEDGCTVVYKRSERTATTVSDALLAVGFEPPSSTSRVAVRILVNKRPVEFTDPVKNGDALDVVITPLDGAKQGSAAPGAPSPSATSSTASASGKSSITIESLMRHD